MIYITGDTHGNWSRLLEIDWLGKDDYVIVCGDFGIWTDNKNERKFLDMLNDMPFTTLFVDGNHENFDRLLGDEFNEFRWHGGMAKEIRRNILYLERGYVYTICGKKFFTFGGASSHDIQDGIIDPGKYFDYKKYPNITDAIHDSPPGFQDFKHMLEFCDKYTPMYRINHYSWWAQEMPSEAEKQRGLQSLEKHDFKVDFVISHCCPQHIAAIIGGGMFKKDDLTEYFDDVAKKLTFKTWYFGHYHDNRVIYDKDTDCRYRLLYEDIEEVC